MQQLSTIIREKVSQLDMSIHNLEKKAGLKAGVVQNIIYGRSKNPSINTIKLIAEALNCSIESLINTADTTENKVNQSSKSLQLSQSEKSLKENWNQEQYLLCLNTVYQILQELSININKDQLLSITDEVLNYSSVNGLTAPDHQFAKYLVKKYNHEKFSPSQ